ncbi:MAG TPA: ABC transporter substrate-binding protein [Ktedonobacteraceae bacterium]|nr:ABC transporter substrate-binding protein [Ktedonobacteraceae bacterium]
MLDSCLRTREWSSRKWYLIFCLLLLSTWLVACAQPQAQNKSKAFVTPLAQITAPTPLLTRGILTIGSYTNYLPQEFTEGETDTVVGFDIDLINVLAQRMGLRPHVVQLDFSSLLPSLQEKNVDVVISALPITSDLQKQVDFVPYFKGGESLLVANGNPHHIQGTNDLCGLSVGVRIGTLEENDLRVASNTCKQAGNKPITTIALSNGADVIQLLKTGRVVATYQDAPVSDYYIHQDPSLFAIGGQVTNGNVEGIAIRKGDASILQAVQKAFQAVRNDGTYHFLIMKWGLTTGELTSDEDG